MIHNINETFDNQYKKVPPSDNDILIYIKDGSILINCDNNTITYPTVGEAASVHEYLFSIGEKSYFSGLIEENEKFSFHSIRELRNLSPKTAVFAGICAYHISSWYEVNRYCGKCGSPMKHSDTERAMICTCGNIIYPKICPAVIVAVKNNDKILMTKYNTGYAHWALVAGYNEAGETIEETVHREVYEETGLKVKNLRYYKSQPWGLSSSLLFGFVCDIDGDDTIRIDNVELKEGRWFHRNDISFNNDDFSLTREMIDAFKNKRL